MSTITNEFTKEQLIEHLKKQMKQRELHIASPATDRRFREYLELEIATNEIALTSLEAEPVADIVAWSHPSEERTCDIRWRRFDVAPGLLYTAPPAPASVPDAMGDAGGVCCEVSYADGWNACRAAMLQGSEPVTTDYKLSATTPCKEAPEHIWLQTAGVWPENGEFSELTWCSDNQHQDDTLYVRADVVAGNSPVIPDGWVACSDRMPEEGQEVIIMDTERGEVQSGMIYQRGRFVDFNEEHYEVKNPPYWMPLPSVPSQEIK